MTDRIAVAALLMDLEAELRRLQLWQDNSPSTETLASQQPFCVDTLTFAQWLQFVFLVKMQHLLCEQMPLPNQCSIAPMAEESLRHLKLDTAQLVTVLERLDALLTAC